MSNTTGDVGGEGAYATLGNPEPKCPEAQQHPLLGVTKGVQNPVAAPAGEGKHAVLNNPEPTASFTLPSVVGEGGIGNPFAIFAAGFALLLAFVLRITEADEDRIYENGNRKISE